MLLPARGSIADKNRHDSYANLNGTAALATHRGFHCSIVLECAACFVGVLVTPDAPVKVHGQQ